MKRARLYVIMALLLPVVLMGLYTVALRLNGNFHEVIPGELYRSAQLSAGDLKKYHEEYGIRSVLNLRGMHKGKGWYDAELAQSSQSGMKHYDFAFESTRQLNEKQTLELLNIMANAPKPLLIHCHIGSNRTGLASALYLKIIKKMDHFTAGLQLSPLYGHFPISFSGAYAMDETYDEFQSMTTMGDPVEELILSSYL